MGGTSEIADQPSSGTGFGLIVLLLAITLGILSAVLIVRDGFDITLNEYLDAILAIHDDALAAVAAFLFDPIVTAVFAMLKTWLGWDLQLHTHGKHLFALLWLWLGSRARFMRPWMRPFHLFWGFACALVGGVGAGTSPITHWEIFVWPMLALFVHAVGSPMEYLVHVDDKRLPISKASVFIWALRSTPKRVAEIAAIAIVGTSAALAFPSIPSPGLLALILTIGFLAVWDILMEELGLLRETGFLALSTFVSASLYVLAVYGCAAFIVWVGHALA